MARPTKQGIDYFPHDTVSGKTMFTLESQFGNDGYAFWFKLLELLGTQDGLFYDCRNPSNWMFLVAKTRVSEETATKILNLLAALDAIEMELWQQKIIWVQKYVDRVEDVYKKRKAETPQRPSFRSENNTSTNVIGAESTQSKVKESKANKSNNISVPDGTPDNHQVLFEKYLSLNLVRHTKLTKEMRSAIDTARRRCGYSWEELSLLVKRHAYIVQLTKDQGRFAVEKRGIVEFFGQKVKDGAALICSEYADDGAKWLRYKDGIPQDRAGPEPNLRPLKKVEGTL